MCANVKYIRLNGIQDFAKVMIETKKDKMFLLVSLLMKLVLILPVTIASIEKTILILNFVNNRL